MMKAYSKEVAEDLEKAKIEVAKLGVRKIKEKSPVKTGDYKRGWRRKKTRTGQIIHNKDEYRLTHLLEHGHAKRNGGRTKAQPHIKPVEIDLSEEFEAIVRRKLSR